MAATMRWPASAAAGSASGGGGGGGGRRLVRLRRGLAVGLAAGLLRPRQRDRAVPGDDQGRRPVGRDAAADGALGVRREAARPLPPRRRARPALVTRAAPSPSG